MSGRGDAVVLCQADADAFFAVLCRIIDREIERVVREVGDDGLKEGANDRTR